MESKSMSTTTNDDQNLYLFWFVTVYGLFAAFVPTLTMIIISLVCKESERNVNLRKQIKELRLELGGISMLNEFAKYTRIQRKIDKMSDELKSENSMKTVFQIKLKFLIYAILYTVNGFVMAYLMWYYRYTPLLILSSNVFYPFGSLLSFPTGIEGAVGVTPWLVVVTSIGRRIERHVS